MIKYRTVLFDLDGTLTDPQVGITRSVQYALARMGIMEQDLEKLIYFIGPPLAASFMECYGMDETRSRRAVGYYREYFSQTGIFENAVYPGIEELLTELRQTDKTLAVATSKPGVFANRILEHFNLSGYFRFVAGSNLDGTLVEKAEVIAYALKNLPPVDSREVVMIGDRKHDIIGAKKNGIASIAVGYGYGAMSEILSAKPNSIASTVDELSALLL
jgi:phosphoglycolate phosphatase